MTKVGTHVQSLNTGYESELRDKDIAYFNALGRFVDAHTLVPCPLHAMPKTSSAAPAPAPAPDCLDCRDCLIGNLLRC